MNIFNIIVLLIGLFVFSACGQNKINLSSESANEVIEKQYSVNQTEEFRVKEISFKLIEDNSNCWLIYSSENSEKKLKLNIPAPCKVVRTETNEINVFIARDKINEPNVFQIAGGIRKDDSKCQSGNHETGDYYQLVTVIGKKIEISEIQPVKDCIYSGLSSGEIYWALLEQEGKLWRKSNNISENEYLNIDEINKFRLNKLDFELVDENSVCYLKYKNNGIIQQIKIDIPAPCKLIRTNSFRKIYGGDVIIQKYPQFRTIAFLVGGGVEKNKICKYDTATSFQAVLVKNDEVKMSIHKSYNVCLPGGLDNPQLWSEIENDMNSANKIDLKK